MKHFGDITKISGYDVPPVDIITGGSPCQDLSVAGKRAGLDGERSGLFMEQIRVIREMRDADRQRTGNTNEFLRPRFMVFENVTGLFSSNGGEDFRIVLEETARVADSSAVIPRLPDGQDWSYSGVIMADGWSIAWRTTDTQFWGKTIRDSNTGNVRQLGTPQRRRRVSLIADFGGQSAGEILFEQESLPRDPQSCKQERQTDAGNAKAGIGTANYTVKIRGGTEIDSNGHGAGKGALVQKELAGTLGVVQDQTLFQNIPQVYDASRRHDYEPYNEVCGTVQAHYGTGGGNVPIVIEGNGSRESHKGDGYKESDVMYTLNTVEQHAVCYRKTGHPMSADDGQGWEESEVNDTLNIFDNSETRTPTVILENHPQDSRIKIKEDGIVQTLSGKMGTGGGNVPMIMTDAVAVDCRHGLESDINLTLQSTAWKNLNSNNTVRTGQLVRRLTPLECERLQGYPDFYTQIGEWTDSKGKKHKNADAPRLKALGNSIALPYWQWLANRICKQLRQDGFEDLTMASLFDGIGGFPLVYSRCGCRPVWASEIEEFPIAVTKFHFGED